MIFVSHFKASSLLLSPQRKRARNKHEVFLLNQWIAFTIVCSLPHHTHHNKRHCEEHNCSERSATNDDISDQTERLDAVKYFAIPGCSRGAYDSVCSKTSHLHKLNLSHENATGRQVEFACDVGAIG